MLKTMVLMALGVMLLPVSGRAQQLKLTTKNDHPKVGDVVVIEVNISADSNTKINWLKESGDGDFKTNTTDQSSVQFVPSKPDEVVIIVCQVSTPQGGQQTAKQKLSVEPSEPAKTAAGGPERPAAVSQAGVPAAPGATAHGETLKIDSIDHMVPSGYMGDAMSEHGGTVNLDPGYNHNCHEEPSCYRLEYMPGQVGWAAIGWQYVTEGGMNWGETPGVDLQAHGFRSLRIWAAGEPSSTGTYPRVQFKSGGNTAPRSAYNASYAVSGPTVQLGAQLEEFCLDLTERSLANVVSPFTVVVTRGANPAGANVIISDVHYSTQACPHQ
jgi:hypothetical protein